MCPDFSLMVEKALKLCKKRKRVDENAKPIVVSRFSLLSGRSQELAKKNIEGKDRLDMYYKFMDYIDTKYMRRSLGQRSFHRNFLIACLPHVIGDDAWTKHREYYLNMFDEDQYKAEILVTTPRRFGKTTAGNYALVCGF